jgi:hypothetical protein
MQLFYYVVHLIALQPDGYGLGLAGVYALWLAVVVGI